MAEKKVNRHNHPLMVNARRESYFAGKCDGLKEGYQRGVNESNDALKRYYETILAANQKIVDLANEIIEKDRGEVK